VKQERQGSGALAPCPADLRSIGAELSLVGCTDILQVKMQRSARIESHRVDWDRYIALVHAEDRSLQSRSRGLLDLQDLDLQNKVQLADGSLPFPGNHRGMVVRWGCCVGLLRRIAGLSRGVHRARQHDDGHAKDVGTLLLSRFHRASLLRK